MRAASEPGRRQPAANRERRMIVLGIELEALRRFLADRHFGEYVITGVVGLVALRSLARESRTRMLARLVAWDKRQKLRYQRKVKARRPGAG